MEYGDKPKRKKDDNENKGRRSGKGPKPMKVPRKVKKESAKQERKNLLTENPVVNRSKEPVVKRFQGSTKKLGNTVAMNAMLKNALKSGLAADLGSRLAKATVMPKPKMPKAIKQPLAEKIEPPKLGPLKATWSEPKKTSSASNKTFTPSKRDMELKEAHLGSSSQQSAEPAELTFKKAGGAVKPPTVTRKGPKPQRPKSKSMSPKSKRRYTKTAKTAKKVKKL